MYRVYIPIVTGLARTIQDNLGQSLDRFRSCRLFRWKANASSRLQGYGCGRKGESLTVVWNGCKTTVAVIRFYGLHSCTVLQLHYYTSIHIYR